MAMILSALYHDDSSRIFWVKALRKLWWRCPKTKPSSSEFRSNPRGVQSYSKFQLPLVISSRDHQVRKCLTCPKQAYGIPLLPCSLDYLDYTWFHLITLDYTWFHLITLDYTWFHLITLDYTWFHLITLDYTWFHLITLDYTWFHLITLDYTWFHLITFDYTWFHLITLDYTWLFPVSLVRPYPAFLFCCFVKAKPQLKLRPSQGRGLNGTMKTTFRRSLADGDWTWAPWTAWTPGTL